MLPPKMLLYSDDPETGHIWQFVLAQRGVDAMLITASDKDSTDRRSEQALDMVIIDVDIWRQDIATLVQRLRTEITVPIVVLMLADELQALAAYEIGVDDVIYKPITPRMLLAKISAWLRRSWSIPTNMLDNYQVGELRLEPALRQIVTGNGRTIKLTSLEFRVLHLLMSHPGQIMETSLIVDRVWGMLGGDSNLLKNVVYRLRRKIEPDPAQPRYIQSIAGEGYMFSAT